MSTLRTKLSNNVSFINSIIINKRTILDQDEIKDQMNIKHVSKCIIAGSLGPYGKCSFLQKFLIIQKHLLGAILANGAEFRGDYVDNMTSEELKDFHRPRLRALLRA